MRILVRLLLGLLALAVLLVVAVLVLLPPLAKSEAVRSRLHAEARAATGRDVSWSDLDLGLLPPRLVLREARVGTPGEGPAFQADEVGLEVALWPLFARVLLVDSVRVAGAQLDLVRTPEALLHPFSAPASSASADAPAVPPQEGEPVEAEAPTASEGGDELSFAVREVRLDSVNVSVRDESVTPAQTHVLGGLSGTAVGALTTGTMDVDFRGTASGGGVHAHGKLAIGGDLELHLDLDGVRLDPGQAYAPAGTRLAGEASGRLTLRRENDQDQLDVALTLAGADLASGDAIVQGALRVDAAFDVLEPLSGQVTLDAAEARLQSADQFTKPAGVPARISGRVQSSAAGVALSTGRMVLGEVTAGLAVDSGDTTQIVLTDAHFDAAALAAFLPALAEQGAAGPVSITSLRLVAEPLSAVGEVGLAPLRLAAPDAPPLEVRGVVHLEGNRARLPDFDVQVAGEPIALDATVDDLAGSMRLDARVRADRIDSQNLVRAFAPDFDRLEGPLTFDGRLRVPLAGPAPAAEVATGRLRFEIAPGRLEGVSILREAFSDPGEAALSSLLGSRQKELARFEEDRFEKLSATVDVAGGRARTDDLQLVYQHYTVDLEGTVGLVDRALDLTGEITVDRAIDETLSGQGGGKKRVFPLAKVTGTVDEPRVVLGDDAVFRLGSAYIRDERRRNKWEGKIDEQLGEGAGKEVLDALDQILRGGKP